MASPLSKPVVRGVSLGLFVVLAGVGLYQLTRHDAAGDLADDAVVQVEDDSPQPPQATLPLDEASAEHKATRSAISDWQPNIDDAIDQLEAILVTDLPAEDMSRTLANLNTLYDTQLYLTFIEYLANLAPEQVPAALREQQHWLATRSELIRQQHGHAEDDGVGAYSIGEVYLQTTRLRLDEISQRLPH